MKMLIAAVLLVAMPLGAVAQDSAPQSDYGKIYCTIALGAAQDGWTVGKNHGQLMPQVDPSIRKVEAAAAAQGDQFNRLGEEEAVFFAGNVFQRGYTEAILGASESSTVNGILVALGCESRS